MTPVLGLLLLLAALPAPAAAPAPLAHFAKAAKHYAEGNYAAARAELLPLRDARLRSRDYVLYYLGQAAYYAGDRTVALDAFHRLAALRESRLAPVASWREADTLAALGKLAEASRLYEQLLHHATPGGDGAVALQAMAQAASLAGRKDQALQLYRRLYVEHPTHPLSDQALGKLQELAPGAAPTPEERIKRANELLGVRQWDRSLEELGKVPPSVPQAVHDEADFTMGMTKFRMRHDYAGAAELLLRIFPRLSGDRAPQALFHGARALSRANQDDRAIEQYKEVVRRFPTTRWAAEAQFLIGWLEFNRGRYEAAQPGLRDLLSRYPRSEFADDATWYLAFSNYLLERWDDALSALERLSRMAGTYNQAKARYWRARIWERKGEWEAHAADGYREVVSEFPLTWYALLAIARLREHAVKVEPFAGKGDSVPPLAAPERKLAGDPAIAKVDELISADLPVEAGEELHRAEPALIRKLQVARALPLVMDRYRRADNWNRIYLLGESYSGRALKMAPRGDAKKWWQAAYPLAYRTLIEKFGAKAGNPDYYLYAIMRKESGFNPHDVSYADAIGLLQMIPPTSKRVAERIDHPYTDDVLYDPAENVRFGAWYIGQLLQKFKGQVPIGAGSFNAGPKPMIRWLGQFGDRPMDEFVELCAYTQTREYMKLVTDNYAHYLYLYSGKVYEVPLTVDKKFVENEIDY